MTNSVQKGIKYAVFTAIISGFSIFLNKYAVGAITPALVFTGSRNFVVALALLAVLLMSGKTKKIVALANKDKLNLFAIAVVGGAIPFYLFFTGLSQVPAINAALLQKTLVVWVVLFAGFVLKEKISLKQLIGVMLVIMGNFLVGGFKGFTFSTPEIMILFSALFWAAEYVIAKKVLKTVDYQLVAFSRMMFGSLLLLGAAAFSGAPVAFNFTTQNIFWLIVSISLLYGYVSSWYKALSLAPAITVSTILVSSTLITNLLSAIFVTKAVSPIIAIQSAVILVGMIVYLRATRAQQSINTIEV